MAKRKKATPPAAEGFSRVRVLTACHINGELQQPDAVVEIGNDALKFHKDLGHVDDAPEAVAYAEGIGGAAVTEEGTDEAE